MKKSILTTTFSALSILLFAQPVVNSSKVEIGKNLINGKVITAIKYEFEDPIFDSKSDTTLQLLTLQFRELTKNGKHLKNAGKVAVFDLKTKNINWSKNIDYSLTQVEQNKDVLFLNSGIGSPMRLNLQTGTELWKSRHVFFATIPNLNIGLGYTYKKFSDELSNKLQGVNLLTGKLQWERTVDKRFGWNGFVILNDSTLIIKSSGLHLINIKTGLGWDYEAITGIEGYSKKIQDNKASVGLEIPTGNIPVTSGYDLLNDLVSNLGEDKSCFFFASKDCLARISITGKIQWKVELPRETSHSRVIIDSTSVYLINDGEAEYNNEKVCYGKPYIAAFDKETGKQEYLTALNTKGSQVLDYILNGNSVKLIFQDRACTVTLKNGVIAETYRYNIDESGNLAYSVSRNNTYIKTGSNIQSLFELDSTATYMFSSNNKIVKLNRNMEFEKIMNLDNIFMLCGQTKQFNFLYNNPVITVTNKKRKIVGELKLSKNIFTLENKLYEVNPNGILEIDLEQAFK